jgi:DNA-binding transcriptional ArsR family regulator
VRTGAKIAGCSNNVPPVGEEGLDASRLAALAHPLRMFILKVADEAQVSPSEVAVMLGEPLGVVAYHFRVLNTAGLIELAATERKRGSIQSFYRPVRPGWGEFMRSLREMVADEEEAPATARSAPERRS